MVRCFFFTAIWVHYARPATFHGSLHFLTPAPHVMLAVSSLLPDPVVLLEQSHPPVSACIVTIILTWLFL